MVKENLKIKVKCDGCKRESELGPGDMSRTRNNGRYTDNWLEYNCPECGKRNIIYSKMVDVRILREIDKR